MNELQKDVLFLLTKDMDLPDLKNFCLSCKIIHEKIFKNNDIWYYKLTKEFPEFNKLDRKQFSVRDLYYILYDLRMSIICLGKNYSVYEYLFLEEISIAGYYCGKEGKDKGKACLIKLLSMKDKIPKSNYDLAIRNAKHYGVTPELIKLFSKMK